MRSRFVIIECAGYISGNIFCGDYNNIPIGVLHSQLKNRKERKNERKRQKEAENAEQNATLSPHNKRRLPGILQKLSPRPRIKNPKKGQGQSVEHVNNKSPNNNVSDDIIEKTSDSVAITATVDVKNTETHQFETKSDSAANLDNQSDSAIQMMDNSEMFKDNHSENMTSEVANYTSLNVTINSDVVEGNATVPVIVNEYLSNSGDQSPKHSNMVSVLPA